MENEEMNITEALVEKTEQNQIRKDMELVEKSKTIEEAVEKLREQLKK